MGRNLAGIEKDIILSVQRSSILKTTTVWILGDQLLETHPALEAARDQDPDTKLIVLLLESRQLIQRIPAPALKLALVLSAMRHYAASLEETGLKVEYLRVSDFAAGLQEHAARTRPETFITMASANAGMRGFQQRTLPKLGIPEVIILPNTQFLVGRHDPFPNAPPEKTVRQETFYRRMRTHFKVLIDEDGKPLGGKWNYDALNRKRLPDQIQLPGAGSFSPDEITARVIAELDPEADSLKGFNLAVDHAGARAALEEFIQDRLPDFGAYEDAMTVRSPLLYHSRLSPYLNLGLLDPLEVIHKAEGAYHAGQAPINSVEGFIRQILGWREFMYWQYWRLFQDTQENNHFSASLPLPAFFWGEKTTMYCLDTVISRARKTGYNHHIERLMILSNFCTLAGINPQEVLGWFMASYIDAYPWVMAPNLLGMGLHADGGQIGTKPYISSANYINRMSDYCSRCSHSHQERTGKKACPFNFLYWNFLSTHQSLLKNNPRMALSLRNLDRMDPENLTQIRAQSRSFLSGLEAENLSLEDL